MLPAQKVARMLVAMVGQSQRVAHLLETQWPQSTCSALADWQCSSSGSWTQVSLSMARLCRSVGVAVTVVQSTAGVLRCAKGSQTWLLSW